jgi:hypothetical protein
MSYAIEHLSLNVELTTRESLHPWGRPIWSIKKIGADESENTLAILTDDNSSRFSLPVELHQLHCESYYQNLISAAPKIYLICHVNESERLIPHILTVDYDEANSYMESDEMVLMAPLSEPLCLWLERFVIEHYTPEQRKKRQRKKWHDGAKS